MKQIQVVDEFRCDHYLDLFQGIPKFKSLATLVNSQLVCLRPVAIINNVKFNVNLNHLFHLCARPVRASAREHESEADEDRANTFNDGEKHVYSSSFAYGK